MLYTFTIVSHMHKITTYIYKKIQDTKTSKFVPVFCFACLQDADHCDTPGRKTRMLPSRELPWKNSTRASTSSGCTFGTTRHLLSRSLLCGVLPYDRSMAGLAPGWHDKGEAERGVNGSSDARLVLNGVPNGAKHWAADHLT